MSRTWQPFKAELLSTASQASWGVWALCVMVLAAIAVALLGVVFSLIF